jgi:hypothetical protein
VNAVQHAVGFSISARGRATLLLALISAMLLRAAQATAAALQQDWEPWVAFGFSVIFPATLALLLLRLPAAQTAEGVLMRIATVLQMVWITAFPSWALLLLLGLPVAFLFVEVLETRVPERIRVGVRRTWVAECQKR